MRYMRFARPAQVVESLDDDDWDFWGRHSADGFGGSALPMPSQASASQRFRRALEIGNPRQVRAAAAELPDIGIAEAAAILLVIERTEPENYEPTARAWLAQLATDQGDVDLGAIAQAATALQALPREPRARESLAEVCERAGLEDAASVFASGRRRHDAMR
jgi:hypothetical protein